LVGFFLAVGIGNPVEPLTLILLIGSSLSLYCAGLVLNDLFDLKIDRKERPERPLASGAVSTGSAIAVSIVLLAAALAMSAAAGIFP